MACPNNDGSDLVYSTFNQEGNNFEEQQPQDLESSVFESFENHNHNVSLNMMAPDASTHEDQYELEGPEFAPQTQDQTTELNCDNANVLDFSNEMPQSFPNFYVPPPNEQLQSSRITPMASTRAVEAMQRSLQAFMLLSDPQNPTVNFLSSQSLRKPQNHQGTKMLAINSDSQSQITMQPNFSPGYVNTRTATSSIYGQQPNMVNVQRNAVDFETHVNSRHPELLHGNLNIPNSFQRTLVGEERNSVNSESHGTSMNPALAYGNKNFQNLSQPNMVGAESNFVKSKSHAIPICRHPSWLYGTPNIQNQSQTTIHSGNIQHVAAPMQQQLSMSQNIANQMSNFQQQRHILHGPTLSNLQPHSATMQGLTTLPFSMPSSMNYIPESSSTGKLLPGTIQRITVTPAPSAPTNQQNNKGVVINQKDDNTAKKGEKGKEPKLKRRGPGRPPKRQGYDLCKLPTKVQKIGESSSVSGKAESSVTPQKEQMTSENVNKEDQIASKGDSQVESRKEYENAIFHKNSDWPLDIHLKKFKDLSGK